jgi:DNA-directed RNA polymerase alpha subunit
MKNNFEKFLYETDLQKYSSCEKPIYDFLVKCEFPDLINKAIGMDYFFLMNPCSMRDVAKQYEISAERVRQQLCKFIRLILRPCRYDYLLAHLDGNYKALIEERDSLQQRLNAVIMELRDYRSLSTEHDTNQDIKNLEFSIRTQNVLDGLGIKTVNQLTELTELDLLRVRNCGKKCLQEIKQVLDSVGLRLL